MKIPLKRPLIALLLLLIIVLAFGCGKDNGVAPIPIEETDFWQQTNGPCGETVTSLAINSSGHIFAGTSGIGVFRSEDNGDNWTEVNTGLTSTYVRALAINSSGHIFAGTDDGGVYCSVESTN
jgi:ligand-binding sensor domain-containing protein